MKVYITKEIIFEYLNGNTTAWQKKQIDQWIQLDGNEEVFYQYVDEWEKSHLQYLSNVDNAITRYHEIIKSESGEIETHSIAAQSFVSSSKRIGKFRVLIACAMSLLLLLINGDTVGYVTILAAAEGLTEYELEDQSKVVLAPGASIHFKKLWLHQKERIVWLKGDAKFIVNHLKDDKKFLVKAENNIDISVLGTTFFVTNSSQKTEIRLEEGAIELKQLVGTINHQMAMVPGEVVVAHSQGIHKETLVENDEKIKDTVTEHRFSFNQTSLQEITLLLENTYQVKSNILTPEIASVTLSGSFKATHYLELVSSLAEILNIRFKIEKDQSITFY